LYVLANLSNKIYSFMWYCPSRS